MTRRRITPANVHDTVGARCLLAGLKYFVPRLTRSGLTKRTKDKSWLTGVGSQGAGISKWSSARPEFAGGASNRTGGSLNGRFLGYLEIGVATGLAADMSGVVRNSRQLHTGSASHHLLP